MIFSTLPDLPGRAYDVVGVVVSQTWLNPRGKDDEIHRMFDIIVQQASDMGADAIIDIKMTAPSGNASLSPAIIITGCQTTMKMYQPLH